MAHTSNITIYKDVPLTLANTDVLVFGSKQEQTQYFNAKIAFLHTDAMYVRDGSVFLNNQAGLLKSCNYMSYTNPDVPNKTFYAFITAVDYLADGTTRVSYIDDVFQTWYFEMTVGQCFVAREHVNNDAIGAHLKEEPVALGPYLTNDYINHYFNSWWIVVVTAVLFSSQDFPPSEGYVYSGIYSGLAYYCYDITDIDTLSVLLTALAGEGKSDAIVSMYMIPKEILTGQNSGTYMKNVSAGEVMDMPNTKTLDGYTPRNKKLLCYPYRSLRISNNSGASTELRYEFFGDNGDLFYRGSPFPNGRMILWPRNYAGKSDALDYSISLGEYPQCSWLKDVYANWLATQSIRYGYALERQERNMNRGMAEGTAKMAASYLTNNLAGIGTASMELANTVLNGVYELEDIQASMNEEMAVHSITPPSAQGSIGNENTLNIIHLYGWLAEEITITAEYAKSIDFYLDLFGYKVDIVKVPNIFGRRSWNYVKTVNAVVTGSAPQAALQYFRDMLNRGVRFWHSTDIGNYTQSNAIV